MTRFGVFAFVCAFFCAGTFARAQGPSEFELTSPAFSQGGVIPKQFTADGDGTSPPLNWSGLPKGTSELALVIDDPDAPGGTYTHWVLYGISPGAQGLPESFPSTRPNAVLGNVKVRQGVNSTGRLGYAPPSPPPGRVHHYHFKLFALDRKIDFPAGLSSAQLQSRMGKHFRGETELVGTYGR